MDPEEKDTLTMDAFLGSEEATQGADGSEAPEVEVAAPEVSEEVSEEAAPEVEAKEEAKEEAPKEDKIDFTDFEKEMGFEPAEVVAHKAAPVKESFDFADYTPAEQKLFKQMSTPAKEWAASLVKERRDLNKKLTEASSKSPSDKLPSSFYDHPEGYQLSDNYKLQVNNVNAAQMVLNHWEEQEAKAEEGEDWQDLDYDEKTGKFFLGSKVEVSRENKVQLRRHLRHATLQLETHTANARTFAQQFQQKQQANQTNIAELESKFFPQFKDEKFRGWEYANSILEKFKQQGQGANPLANIAAKSVAVSALVMEYIKAQKGKVSRDTKIKADAKAAGPGILHGADGKKGSSSEVTMEDFYKEMEA